MVAKKGQNLYSQNPKGSDAVVVRLGTFGLCDSPVYRYFTASKLLKMAD